ncbi:L-threonylcarbamoyladenylate synthase [Gemmatimonas aurantiaca]|uniref:L-threonylcarbamoyladenylate synthase n=1 Tax=Gemmatimonas aurantiaca TaxID=173480 RepID=UPI00301CBBCA
MRVVTVDPVHPDPSALAEAAALIRAGELVAFPTETVYGLGANALDADAVVRIYAAKGRPAWNPVIVHAANAAEARRHAATWPRSAERLAERCWPGPLTLVVPRAAHIPDVVAAGGETVALRVPAHPVALALIDAAGCPIAAPSANRFTRVSPTTAQHVVASLGDRVPLVLDGGPCTVGIESTVVDCGEDVVTILRPGMIGRETLEAALDGLGIVVRHATTPAVPHGEAMDTAMAAPTDSTAHMASHVPRSPGMADRHYAPRADVWLFTPAQREEVETALRERAETTVLDGLHPVIGLLRTITFGNSSVQAMVQTIAMPAAPMAYAQALYAALHEVDARGASLVLIEAPPDEPGWDGIRDRLTRASR